MMRWKKLGRIYDPKGAEDWALSHAANPVAEHLYGNKFQIYFSCRDSSNRGQIGSVKIEISKTNVAVIQNSLNHVLSHGKLGRFDDSGVTVTGLVKQSNKKFLYYLGWNLGRTIPFRNAIGVAVCQNFDEQFFRISEAPIVDRSSIDPISLSYPFLLYRGDRYCIWYGSCIEWFGESKTDYKFSLKYAESSDGILWHRTGEIALPCDYPSESAIARPHVIFENNIFKMWYSKKIGESYRIGYAESIDGRKWSRLDHRVGIDVSETGWDSEMIEYPYVFDHLGSRYMLYNGNGYGKTGFGLAILGH